MSIEQTILKMEMFSTHQSQLGEKELILEALDIDAKGYDRIISFNNQGQKNICNAFLKVLFYQCYECGNGIVCHAYCPDCMKPEKHQGKLSINLGHVITYWNASGGSCDCGDIQTLKEESCCEKHQPNNQAISTPNIEEILISKYRHFIQVSFALLFNKIEQIVDYPPNFEQNLKKAQTILNDEELNYLIELKQEKLQQFSEIQKQIDLLYQRITLILQTVTDENMAFSLLTSQLLQEPIEKDIQSIIQFHHIHSNSILISIQPQVCSCSILELFIKYYQFLRKTIIDNFVDNIFINIQQDISFKPFLAKLILENYFNLYLPRQKCKFITLENNTFQFMMNRSRYSEDPTVDQTVQSVFQFIKNKKYKELISVNYLKKNKLAGYFIQMQGAMATQLSKLMNKPNQNQNFFMIYQQNIKELYYLNIFRPLWTNNSRKKIWYFTKSFEHIISLELNKSLFFEQIKNILKENYYIFMSSLIDCNSQLLNSLSNNAFLISLLTQMVPCQVTEVETFFFESSKINKIYKHSLDIQTLVLQRFRLHLSQIINFWKDQYQSNQFVFENILQITISYFIKNFTNSFQLEGILPIQDFLKNQIISDRNFITVLAIYISKFQECTCARESFLGLCNIEQVKISMFYLLKRTILSYITFHFFENNQLYHGDDSLEQVDLAFFQIYALIFQEEGINDIIEEYKNISEMLRQTKDISNIICKICQSDFEYIQVVGCYQREELSYSTSKGIQKLFQTIFFAQNFYAAKDLIQILKTLKYNESYNLEKFILTACELNQDNDSLYLKKNLLPANYEPIYAEQIKSLKESIVDKLRTQNDGFTELFGNALAYELSQSEVTSMRREILKAIITDKKQLLLQEILRKLQNYEEKGKHKKIKNYLEQYAVYLNLLFQANKFIGQNEIICNCLSKIKEICIQNKQHMGQLFDKYIQLLDEQSVQGENQIASNSVQKQQIKKQQLLQRFNQMSQVFKEQHEEQNEIQQKTFCSKCQLPINDYEIQYKPVLLEYTNQHKYYCQAKIQIDQEIDLLQVHTTCCGHLYHYKCLQSIRSKHKQGQKIYQCYICFSSFNFYFMNPVAINNFENREFVKNIEFIFNLIPKEKLQYYYKQYATGNKLQLSLVITELFSCSLYSLLLQLLSDINQFYQRKNHLFLQEILMLLKLAYSENFVNILDLISNNDSILYKLFKVLIQNVSFKYSEIEFQQELENVLQDTQNMQPIIEMITQPELKSQMSLNIYDIVNYKQELKNMFQNQFGNDFKQFAIKFNLAPCGKKKCKFLPLYEGGEQCICLICLKKMCSKNCGSFQNVDLGNLSRHSQKKHMNKAIFMKINTSQIFVMQAPLIVNHNQTLFQNLIGQQPQLGRYQQEYYQSFKLNLKVVDWIVDVIIGYKYLNKIFADTSQIIRSNL